MSVQEEAEVFVGKVLEMRRVQKEFFKNRSYAAMQLAKSLEKEVDDLAERLSRHLDEQASGCQLQLFGGQ
ncbi:MAG: hypothetical protein II837_04910 [Treponema sp.]|nr:hypothetical protein [Treponema sp.]MBQ7166151.1 hypothetical protein [Treponema sp.]